MTDIFVSYSRRDSLHAKKIVEALRERGFNVWMDETSIPSGEELSTEIIHGVANSDFFMYLISPDAVASEWCRQEVETASRMHKKILPVLILETEKQAMPAAVQNIKWIPCPAEQEGFEEYLEGIVTAIRIDQKWVKFHTKLQNKATEWLSFNDTSRLLRGKELLEADQMLATYEANQELKPTEEQLQYLFQSRQHEAKVQRNLTLLAVVAVLILMTATVIAVMQRNVAIRTAEVNQSLALSAYAQNAAAQNDHDLAQALIMEAVNIQDPPPQTVSTFSQISFDVGTRLVIPVNERYGVFRLAISPDGDSILSVTGGGDIQLWDRQSGREIRRIGDHGTYDGELAPLVPGVAFTPNSQIAVTAGGEDIRFWDLGTGTLLRKIVIGKNLGFNVADFTEDTKYLVWGSSDGSVHYWDLTTGQELVRLIDSRPNSIESIAINMNGTRVLAGTEDGRVILWDLVTGQKINEYQIRLEAFEGENQYGSIFRGVAFSPDERYVVGSAVSSLEIWNIDTKEIVQHFNITQSLGNPRFSPDGKYLLVPTIDGVQIWELDSGRLAFGLNGHSDNVFDAVFSPDGNQVVSGSLDGTMRIWDLHSDVNIKLEGHTARVASLDISADGKVLVSSSWDGSTRLWDVQTGQEIQRFKSVSGTKIRSSALSPDGKTLLVAEDEMVSLIPLTGSDARLQVNGVAPQLPTGVGFLGDGGKFFTLNLFSQAYSGVVFLDAPDGGIQVRDIATGSVIQEFFNRGLTETIYAAAANQDGTILLTSHGFASNVSSSYGVAGAINGWDVRTEKKIINIPIGIYLDIPVSIVISPDGKVFATGSHGGDVVIYETESGQPIRKLSIKSDMVASLAFSHDGRMLAASDMGDSLVIWNTADWSENSRQTISNTGFVQSLVFAVDDSVLYGGTESGDILTWQVHRDLDTLIQWVHANRHVRPFTCEERKEYNLSVLCDADGNVPVQQETQTPVQFMATPTKENLEPVVPATSNEILYTQKISGVMDGAPLLYSFDAQAGTKLSILVESNQFDPYLILKDWNGNILQVNDDDPSSLSNRAVISNLEIKRSGTYYVIVDGFLRLSEMSQGDFQVILTAENDNDGAPIVPQPVERGLFGMNFSKGLDQPVKVLGAYSESAVGQAGILPGDSILSIEGMETHHLSERQVWDLLLVPSGVTFDFLVGTRNKPDGVSMSITSNSGSSGEYVTINQVELGIKPFGYVEKNGTAVWEFWGEKDQEYSILLGGMNVFTGNMEILSATGKSLMKPVKIDNRLGLLVFTPQLAQPFRPQEDGYYYIKITDDKVTADVSTFTLALQRLKNNGILKPEIPVEGELSATDGNYWTFLAEDGQILKLRLDIKDSKVEPFLILMAPDGSVIGRETLDGFDKFSNLYDNERYPSNFLVNGIPLQQSGEYTLILLPYLRGAPVKKTGTFSLMVGLQDIQAEALLESGIPIKSKLSAGEVRMFGYQGVQGEKIRITVLADQPASTESTYFAAAERNLLDTVIIVLDSNGELLDGNDDHEGSTDSYLEMTLPADGLYVIEVATNRNFGKGEFTIMVESIQ